MRRKQSKYGIVTLRIEHNIRFCVFKHAERLAEEANQRDAENHKLVERGAIKSFDAAAILRIRGIAALEDAPTHSECLCNRCSPNGESAAFLASFIKKEPT